jgi:hypothetical protein
VSQLRPPKTGPILESRHSRPTGFYGVLPGTVGICNCQVIAMISIKLRYLVVISILIFSTVVCQSSKNIKIYDGFETSNISKVWSKDKLLFKSFEIQSKIVRNGNKAIKITLNQGDQLEEEKGTELERAELMEFYKFVSKEDASYSYSFSMFLPNDFPIIQTRLVIAQWKQYCENKDKCGNNSPVIAIRYIGGELIINVMQGPKKVILFTTKEEARNRWLDFKFNIHFSKNNAGKIYAWLNGEKIVEYTGKIGYTEKDGYPSKSYYYFKMGLYRDTMPEPMTIYIDEYRKEQLPKGSI